MHNNNSPKKNDPKRGLYVSFNAVVNDKETTAVQSTQQLALWYKGPFDSRPNDSIGFGIANYSVNDRYTDRQIATIPVVAMTNMMHLRQIMFPYNVMSSMLS
jgi:carbohydrate-selective porin OprB